MQTYGDISRRVHLDNIITHYPTFKRETNDATDGGRDRAP